MRSQDQRSRILHYVVTPQQLTRGRAATEIRLFKNYRIGPIQIPRILTDPQIRMPSFRLWLERKVQARSRKHRSGKKQISWHLTIMEREWRLRDDLPSEFQSPGEKINVSREQVHQCFQTRKDSSFTYSQLYKELRSRSGWGTELALEVRLSTPESRGSQPQPHTASWEVSANTNAQVPLWTK